MTLRPPLLSQVRVAARDARGRALAPQVLVGERARALQHELDHLDGVLILDHSNEGLAARLGEAEPGGARARDARRARAIERARHVDAAEPASSLWGFS